MSAAEFSIVVMCAEWQESPLVRITVTIVIVTVQPNQIHGALNSKKSAMDKSLFTITKITSICVFIANENPYIESR
jgi:hypothetical protein